MSSPTPTQVTDRLERLAHQAPTRLGDPDQLWSRGRRRQRGRWAGTAAVLVVLAVLGAVAVPPALQRSQDLVADSSDSDLRLPDVIRQPGEWEGTFSGAPGRLVAVGVGSRGGWWSSTPAVWGVSATTGEARFLDLPDVAAAGTDEAALSADGRRLAYWLTDEDAQPLPDFSETPVTGVAVVDLATGEVVRWEVDAPHGLATRGLVWAGDVLWWSGGPWEPAQGGGTSARSRTYTWNPDAEERRELDRGTPGWDLPLLAARPITGGFVVNAERLVQVVRGDRVARTIRLDADGTLQDGPALSLDGSRIAGVHNVDRQSSAQEVAGGPPLTRLLVGGLGGSTTEMVPVGDVESTAVLGWRSDDEVVVSTYEHEEGEFRHGASVVDLDSGAVTHLVDFGAGADAGAFATDAWAAEVIDAPDAPWAPDPRFVGLALLVVGAFVVSVFNSVRRRRGRA